jgi:hypothetical protein
VTGDLDLSVNIGDDSAVLLQTSVVAVTINETKLELNAKELGIGLSLQSSVNHSMLPWDLVYERRMRQLEALEMRLALILALITPGKMESTFESLMRCER